MAEFGLEHGEKPDKKREELKGKVLHLPDLVDYAEARSRAGWSSTGRAGVSPSSRSMRTRGSPSIPPLRCDGYPPDGECEVWVAGKTFPMKTGETIIFPAGAPHALSALTKFKMSLVMIKE